MEMRRLRYFVGTTAAIGLLLTAAGHAWMQGERAADGKTLSGESADTQAMFQNTFGPDADREWVAEHNATIESRGGLPVSLPPVAVPPAASEAPLPPAMPTDMVMTTPTAGGATATPTEMGTPGTATAMATAATAQATVMTTPGAAGAPGGPAVVPPPAPPTPVNGAKATANTIPQPGIPPTSIPRCAFSGSCPH